MSAFRRHSLYGSHLFLSHRLQYFSSGEVRTPRPREMGLTCPWVHRCQRPYLRNQGRAGPHRSSFSDVICSSLAHQSYNTSTVLHLTLLQCARAESLSACWQFSHCLYSIPYFFRFLVTVDGESPGLFLYLPAHILSLPVSRSHLSEHPPSVHPSAA